MPQLRLSLADQAFHRFGFVGCSLGRVFKFAKEAGFCGVELTETLTSRFLSSQKIRSLSAHYDLPVLSVHHSVTRTMWSSLSSIENIASRASRIGAKAVTIHLAAIHRRASNVGYFAKVREIEKRYQVFVGFENAMAQFSFLKLYALGHTHDPIRFRDVIVSNNLHATYDIGHMASLAPDPVAYYETIKEHLVNVHVQDYRSGFDHLSLGSGVLPLVGFFQHLARTNYTGLITLEVFPLNHHLFMTLADVERVMRENLAFFIKHSQVPSVNIV
ncbi:MAG: sugar phosphate isomerase/epimerase [Patescibacteria group bacterium]|jgi:sugar phosphate isomerase/epimerase